MFPFASKLLRPSRPSWSRVARTALVIAVRSFALTRSIASSTTRHVVSRSSVGLRRDVVAAFVPLVERSSGSVELRGRHAAEGDQRALGVGTGVDEEGTLVDRVGRDHLHAGQRLTDVAPQWAGAVLDDAAVVDGVRCACGNTARRSEEHTSELQSRVD